MELFQHGLELQFKSKHLLKAEEVLPHPTTVGRGVIAATKTQRELLKQTIASILNDGQRIAFTSDIWTDPYKQVSYLTITAHWINDEWSLMSKVLCTNEFDATKKKTGDNIKAAIVTLLQELGVSMKDHDVTFTTDRGSNMISALKSENRLDCTAHIINTVLRNAFDTKKGCPAEITDLLSAVKGLVRYFKKTGFQTLLPRALQQSCDTRWNSIYFMLDSVESQFIDIQQVLLKQVPNELRRHTAIEKELLTELLPFLKVNVSINCIYYF